MRGQPPWPYLRAGRDTLRRGWKPAAQGDSPQPRCNPLQHYGAMSPPGCFTDPQTLTFERTLWFRARTSLTREANRQDPFWRGIQGCPIKISSKEGGSPASMDCQSSDEEPHVGLEHHIKSSPLGRFWPQASPGHIRTDDRARDSTRVSSLSGLPREPLRENEKMASVPKVTCKFQ